MRPLAVVDGSRAGRVAAGLLVLLACLGELYARELSHGFRTLPGDLIDTRIADTLQVHWWNVLGGREPWWRPLFFHPTPDPLGYNDGYLLFGLFMSAFHLLGADVLLAAELAAVPIQVAGFVGLYVLGREALALPRAFALLAAVVGVLSNGLHLEQVHQQLLTAYLSPVLGALAWRAGARARAGRMRSATIHASLAALLVSVWSLTAFYMLWFTGLFTGIAILAHLARRPASLRPALHLLAGPAFQLPLVLLVLGLVPFLIVYLPTSRLGSHPWTEAFGYTVSVSDLVHVGPGNLLADTLHIGGTAFSEHAVGLPPLLWILALGGAALGVRSRRPTLHLPLAAGFVVSLLLALRFGHHTAWRLVFDLVPGADAVRVVCRLMLLLSLVAALLAAVALSILRDRGWPASVLALLATLLVAGQVNTGGVYAIPRHAETAFLARMQAPPADCPVFVVSRPRLPDGMRPDDPLRPMLTETDAMLLAELAHRPTTLGVGSLQPPGVDFDMTRWPAAMLAGGGRPVCAVDLVTGAWGRVTPDVAALAPGARIGFGGAGRSADLAVGGWSVAEPGGGRWTAGPLAVLAFRWTSAAPAVLMVHAAIGFGPPRHPSRVDIFANDAMIATWPNDPVAIDRPLRIPPSAIGPDGLVRLRFRVHDVESPMNAGISPDPRQLGIYVMSIAAN